MIILQQTHLRIIIREMIKQRKNYTKANKYTTTIV